MRISRYDDEELLFSKYGWSGVVRANEEKIKEIAAEKGLSDFDRDFDELVDDLAKEYTPEAPVLLTDEVSVDRIEVEVARPRDPYSRRRSFGGPETIRKNAVEVTVPVEGDTGFFRVQPATSDSAPPRARVAEDHLVFQVIIETDDKDELRASINERIAKIEKYLNWMRQSAEGLASRMQALARSELEHRKKQLSSADDLVKGLGFKVKGE